MLKASFKKHVLNFRHPGGTSRGVLKEKPSWFIKVWEEDAPAIVGVGECSIIPKLSPDDRDDLEKKLADCCENIEQVDELIDEGLEDFPALQFALEMAMVDLQRNGTKELFPSAFTSGAKGIPINGLIWMGEPDYMRKQIREKLEQEFDCLKMKIGALDFEDEIRMLQEIRAEHGPEELELRVDANGAFSPENAGKKLERLAEFGIHSIEQPIAPGQPKAMAKLCSDGHLPIALDEELIGISGMEKKRELVGAILPQYLILKPSLIGGFKGAGEWINVAEEKGISWWVTSALESNIGLNAIAQWTYKFKNPLPQGLGTGQVFSNNVEGPLHTKNGQIHFDPEKEWDLSAVF